MKNLILYGVAGYLFYETILKQLSLFSYKLKGAKLLQFGSGNADISFVVSVKNNSMLPVYIKSFEGDIFKNNIRIGTAFIKQGASIGKGEAADVTVSAKINYAGTASSIIEWIETKDNRVRLKGKLITDKGIVIPVNFQTELW